MQLSPCMHHWFVFHTSPCQTNWKRNFLFHSQFVVWVNENSKENVDFFVFSINCIGLCMAYRTNKKNILRSFFPGWWGRNESSTTAWPAWIVSSALRDRRSGKMLVGIVCVDSVSVLLSTFSCPPPLKTTSRITSNSTSHGNVNVIVFV